MISVSLFSYIWCKTFNLPKSKTTLKKKKKRWINKNINTPDCLINKLSRQSWANPLWWDTLMNKMQTLDKDFLMHVSSSKSAICPAAECTFMRVIIFHMFKIHVQASLLGGVTPFIILPCEIYNQNLLKNGSHCVENFLCGFIYKLCGAPWCMRVCVWSPIKVQGERKWPASWDRRIDSTALLAPGWQCCSLFAFNLKPSRLQRPCSAAVPSGNRLRVKSSEPSQAAGLWSRPGSGWSVLR